MEIQKKKHYTISNLEQNVISVWGNKEASSRLKNRYTAFLLQKQIDEIIENKFTDKVMDKELPDIVLIILQYYSCQNKSTEQYIIDRLQKRHNGQTEQIKKKYHKLYRNYKFPEYRKEA